MSVSSRLGAAVLLTVLLTAPAAEAAPILGVSATGCGLLTSSPNCALLDIDPISGTLGGEFTLDNDIALFQFVLGEGTFDFAAATTSAGAIFDTTLNATGFDPVLTLYRNGVQFTYVDLQNGLTPAEASNPDFDGEAAFPLIALAGGATYTLAITQFGNFASTNAADPTFLPRLSNGFNQDAFPCFTAELAAQCPAGAGLFEAAFRQDLGLAPQTGDFSVALTIQARDLSPVPEPGTLSLLALGAAGAALARRRRARLEPR